MTDEAADGVKAVGNGPSPLRVDNAGEPTVAMPGSGSKTTAREGVLSKWTNYVTGWRDRWFKIEEGMLSYYKSQNDIDSGCRGSVSLKDAVISRHEFDESRLDIAMDEIVYYLRAADAEERDLWLESLQDVKAALGDSGETGSSLSVRSSTSSASTMSKVRTLRERLAEMERYRDVMAKQFVTLNRYHDLLERDAAAGGGETPAAATSYRAAAITCKATTKSMLESLQQCVEVMQRYDEGWQRRVDREVERRHKAEASLKKRIRLPSLSKFGGPDVEEGPHSLLNDGEFYDAIEQTLDENDRRELEKRQQLEAQPAVSGVAGGVRGQHRFAGQVKAKVVEVMNALEDELNEADGWKEVYDDDGMKVYRQDCEEDGVVKDRLRTAHTIPGITAQELCIYFRDTDVRQEWEGVLELCRVVEYLDSDTLISHQVYKKIWPASQRDLCLLSHLLQFPDGGWLVCNFSVDHPKAKTDHVRVQATAGLQCETVFLNPNDAGEAPITRDRIACKFRYVSQVNPGGWIPTSALRAAAKREYPKVLKKLCSAAQAYWRDAKRDIVGGVGVGAPQTAL